MLLVFWWFYNKYSNNIIKYLQYWEVDFFFPGNCFTCTEETLPLTGRLQCVRHDCVPRSELCCSPSQTKVTHFSMTSHREIFDSAASSGMLGHLGGGTPQSAQSWQAFRAVSPLFSAPKPILDLYKVAFASALCLNSCWMHSLISQVYNGIQHKA